MTPEQFAAFMATMQTFDRRLKNNESDIADCAAALESVAESMGKLQELYVAIDRRLEDLGTVMGNYVEATKDLRNESRNLHSMVREKLKAV